MKKNYKETFLRYISGDDIPGGIVSSYCSLCKTIIQRDPIIDDECRVDLKMTTCVTRVGQDIKITWLHLCDSCGTKFNGAVQKYLKEAAQGSGQNSTATPAQQTHGEICSAHICDYCVKYKSDSCRASLCGMDYPMFMGRKLSPC